MNTYIKTSLTLAAIAVIGLGSTTYAQENQKISQLDRESLRELRQSGDRDTFRKRTIELGVNRDKPELTDSQKETIKELRQSGDRDAVKNQLESWGIEKPIQRDRGNGLKIGHDLQNLTNEQKTEIRELRESGAEKGLVQQKLLEFGVELPKRIEITDEQKQIIKNLRDSGNREELKEYYQKLGFTKKVDQRKKRKNFISSLTDNEKEVLENAREIARAGDKEMAKEMIHSVFESNNDLGKPQRGIMGFFKNFFKKL